VTNKKRSMAKEVTYSEQSLQASFFGVNQLADEPNFGCNAGSEPYEDLVIAGAIDPAQGYPDGTKELQLRWPPSCLPPRRLTGDGRLVRKALMDKDTSGAPQRWD
jgi:hypothetical protein